MRRELNIKIEIEHPLDLDTAKVNNLIKGLVFDLQKEGIKVLNYSQIQTVFRGKDEKENNI